MKIEDRFRVDVPIDEAWGVLLDVERIAPCMPGAQLQEIEGDEYRGIVKVKVGPITAQYKGVARFVEVDAGARRAVLEAQGRDTRGQGNASATITMVLVADGDGTEVTIDNDVTVTGKVAQFGRGVMADVSSKLLAQFVECLEASVLGSGVLGGGGDGDAADAVAAEAPGTPPEVEPVDLLRTAGAPVLKRLVPAAIVVAAVVVLLVLLLR
ncbi:MAG TPA: SRPBCC family protein [Acidimicrobiia bacterium]